MTEETSGSPTRYRGTIKNLNPRGSHGFIQRTSLTTVEGESVKLASRSDIFFHHDDLFDDEQFSQFRGGDVLDFELAPDDRRENGFRAQRIRGTGAFPIVDGIEIHIDEQRIAHPSVKLRWCIKPETLAHIEANPDVEWALIFIAQVNQGAKKRRKGAKTAVFSAVGAKRIGDSWGYLPFDSPGDYDLVAYLVRSREPMTEKEFVRRIDRAESMYVADPDYVSEDIWNVDGESLRRRLSARLEHLETIAFSSVKVSVAADIFAPPLAGWKKYFAGYFTSRKFEDQCAMRRRLLPSVFPGIIAIALWEFLKRSALFLFGIVHFLAGGNPLPVWEQMFKAYPAFGDGTMNYYEPMTDFSGRKVLLKPIFVLPALTFVVGIYAFPAVIMAIVIFVGGIFALGLVITAIVRIARFFFKENREAQIARIATYATCGIGTAPKDEPRTIRLMWDGVKRNFCRAYSR